MAAEFVWFRHAASHMVTKPMKVVAVRDDAIRDSSSLKQPLSCKNLVVL